MDTGSSSEDQIIIFLETLEERSVRDMTVTGGEALEQLELRNLTPFREVLGDDEAEDDFRLGVLLVCWEGLVLGNRSKGGDGVVDDLGEVGTELLEEGLQRGQLLEDEKGAERHCSEG